MKRTNANTAVGRFKRVFSEQELNRLGKEVRYCQRERVVTPFRLVMAMLSMLSSRKVETLADLQRGFNALFGESLAYKPFHNQLSKRGFGEFMRACVERLVDKLVLNVLKIKGRSRLFGISAHCDPRRELLCVMFFPVALSG